jgi:hypothetical protein
LGVDQPRQRFDAKKFGPCCAVTEFAVTVMEENDAGAILAPEYQGSARFNPIELAPGRYLKEKSN